MPALDFSQLPVPHEELVRYIAKHPDTSIVDILRPYRHYEAELRQAYAQQPDNEVLKNPNLNVLGLFNGDPSPIQVRARDVAAESQEEKDRYIMNLPNDQRRATGSLAVVQSLKDFRHNFNVFSESSLVDLDWTNVVAAGSSVVNCLLPVPNQYNNSKRALREFYHEKFCPASDVDLFLYGLSEEDAIAKIRQIETAVRDAILTETTTVRTKHAITICSQYPTRHVQIVLRIYKNVSEILTGFDIDSSCAAYDGKQVYCTPRALQSYITQINHIDLSRRSPSYENRLSKYSHRGFEVYWPELDRSRIDPTIFERSFQRTLGLARLLVLERLPTPSSRDQYLARRREERGRPPVNRHYFHRLAGNIKEDHEDEIAEWVDESEVSNYHTFTVPYGIKFHAKKIEKLCYTRDLLLNAEWNQPKDREVYLHRHPAFFGRFDDVLNDCCGFCPKPETNEEKEVYEEESKIYVFGKTTFLKDDPGRQQIGSFNPLTEDDWTEMAYVGNTARLCQDIVDGDLDAVRDWLSQDRADPNTRDYTGRTPLHLAVMSSTPEIVKCLVDNGARLIARLADGRTALHLAAERGDVEIVKVLMEKSAANEAEEEEKQDKKRKARFSQAGQSNTRDEEVEDSNDSDFDVVDDTDSDEDEQKSMATGSFVKVKKEDEKANHDGATEEDEDDVDFFDVNVVAWDTPCSALHFAIVCGHEEVVKLLCQEYGADILLPVKFLHDNKPTAALLSLLLCLKLPIEKAKSMATTILSLGATCAQADMHEFTAFQRFVDENACELIGILLTLDNIGVKNSINHITFARWNQTTWPLQQAIEVGDVRLILQLLDAGAVPQLDFETWLKSAKQSSSMEIRLRGGFENNMTMFETMVEQPIILAIQCSDPSISLELLKRGANVNEMTTRSHQMLRNQRFGNDKGETVLDIIRSQLKQLRQYTLEAMLPEFTYGMDEVLSKVKEGTWQYAAVNTAVIRAKKSNDKKVEEYEKEKARIETLEGVQEKQAAIDSAIATLEQVESEILENGGKTFEQLHPDLKSRENPRPNQWQPEKESPEFKYDFKFYEVSDVTERREAKYIELFEAAWSGDLEKIKSLTLVSWDPESNEPPLQIAVFAGSNSPFSLACSRGHLDVAKAILKITQAQYAPEEKLLTRYRMHTSGESGESEVSEADDSDDDEPKIHGEIVDDQFTVDNIGQVSMQVKSRVKPLDMLERQMPTLSSKDGKLEFLEENCCLLKHIINNNDLNTLKWYYDLVVYFASQDEDVGNRFVAFPQWAFWQAVEQSRIEMLADMMKWAGAGLPLEELVKKSGVELKERPRYYQGLTVYGKKRKDWAAAGRRVISRPTDSGTSPLLHAAISGCIESVEWFLTDAPLRHYLEFGKSKAAKDNVRLKHLNQSPGGFEQAVVRWLGAQNDLVIHAAILGPNSTNTERLVEYLIKVYPSSLEVKNIDGMTPLTVAVWLGRLDLIKLLIANGADQSTKDKSYNNILHIALENNPKGRQLRTFLDLLDPELRSHLFRERGSIQASDGRTPLHRWIENHKNHFSKDLDRYLEVLSVILEYSGGGELDMLDAGGDTPLHSLIRGEAESAIIRRIMCSMPRLWDRENAVGHTPAELAHDKFVRSCAKAPATYWYRHYRGDRSVARALLDKTPEQFALEAKAKAKAEAGAGAETGGETGSKATSRVRQIYDLVTEFAERDPGQRRLVSLHEANDVAQRIGETYQGQRYGWKGFGQKKATDDDQAQEKDVVSVRIYDLRNSAWMEPKKVE